MAGGLRRRRRRVPRGPGLVGRAPRRAPQQADTAQQVDAGRLAATFSGLLFTRGRLREAQQRYEQAAALASDVVAEAWALECAAATAKIRTAGDEALRLDRAAAAAYLRAGDPAAASVAFARCAEHVNRFAGHVRRAARRGHRGRAARQRAGPGR